MRDKPSDHWARQAPDYSADTATWVEDDFLETDWGVAGGVGVVGGQRMEVCEMWSGCILAVMEMEETVFLS